MEYYEVIYDEDYKKAEANGVRKNTLQNRIYNLGWTKEKAINTPPIKPRFCKKIIEIANSNGVCKSTLMFRVKKLNMSAYKAATKEIMSHDKISELGRKAFKEKIRKAKEF